MHLIPSKLPLKTLDLRLESIDVIPDEDSQEYYDEEEGTVDL